MPSVCVVQAYRASSGHKAVTGLRGAVQHELKQLRRWTEAKIKAGTVPDWSWPHHVQLIEAIDAVLQDLSLMQNQGQRRSLLSDRIHLLPPIPRVPSEQPKLRRTH